MSNRKFTDEQEAEIARRYASGESSGVLANSYRCSAFNVLAAVRRNKVWVRPTSGLSFSNDLLMELKDLYDAGAKLCDIARRAGCGKYAARTLLTRAGAEIRTQGASNRLQAKARAVDEMPVWYVNSLRNGATARELEFSVTEQEMGEVFLKQNRRCALTGAELKISPHRSGSKQMTASLDRVDSSLGYVPGNIQWVHKIINLAKMDLPNEEFIRLCNEVARANPRSRAAN